MNNPNIRHIPAITLECFAERVRTVIATLDIIRKDVPEYPISEALYGLMITLSDIEESLDSLGCDHQTKALS